MFCWPVGRSEITISAQDLCFPCLFSQFRLSGGGRPNARQRVSALKGDGIGVFQPSQKTAGRYMRDGMVTVW